MAIRLGISYPEIKLIEEARAFVSFEKLLEITAQTNLFSLDDLCTGYIQKFSPVKLIPYIEDSGFSLPDRYRKNAGSKMRTLTPAIQYATKALNGPDRIAEFLKEKGIDPDIIFDLDAEASCVLNLDIAHTFIAKGDLTAKTMNQYVDPMGQKVVHGNLYERYCHEATPFSAVTAYLENMNLYECNGEYGVTHIKETSMGFYCRHREHVVLDFKSHKDELTRFMCLYRETVIGGLLRSLGHSYFEVTETECGMREGTRLCLFEIKKC